MARVGRNIIALLSLAGGWAGATVAAQGTGVAAPDLDFFEARIRPLLSEHCFKCHSGRAQKLRGGLRLDSRDLLLKGGESGPAVVPGEPAQSRLIEAVSYHNPDLQMPPKSRLSEQQVRDLAEWVKRGVPWPSESARPETAAPAGQAFDLWRRRAAHWAWQPVRPAPPPQVKDAAWGTRPVDAFVLARLEASGLEPAPPADRRTLIRRLSFILTGLPPSAEEVEAFVADTSAGATERVVDRLLASPHFGERWARHWMDLVRYSDTLGNESDMPVHNAWRYRDYLVRAFNADLPYDRLVLEHVAGDLLPDPRLDSEGKFNESVIGTAFYWMTEGKRSPVDLRLAQADAFDNRLDVTCKAFLGLTLACARCHDHKFDAISSADYYGLYGYLKSSRYTQALLNRAPFDAKAADMAALREQVRRSAGTALADRSGGIGDQLKQAGGIHPPGEPDDVSTAWATAIEAATDPTYPLYAWRQMAELGRAATPDAFGARWKSLSDELRARAASDESAARRKYDVELARFERGDFGGWTAEDQAFGDRPLRAGDFLPSRNPDRPVATFVRAGGWAHSAGLSRRLQGILRSPEFNIDRRYLHLLVAGRSSRVTVVVDQFFMIQDPLYGSLRRVLDSDSPRWVTFDLGLWKGRPAYVELADTTTPDLHDMKPPAGCGPEGYAALGRAVLSDQGPPAMAVPLPGLALLDGGTVDSLPALAERYKRVARESLEAFRDGTLASRPNADARAALLASLLDAGLLNGPPSAEIESQLRQWAQVEASLPEPLRAPAMTDGVPQDEYVFVRGNPKSVGPVVPRRVLEALCGPAKDQPAAPARGSGRLELARRIARPDNPLTARVFVNRVWHYAFGRGIVASTDNFGALGDAPTHPELLDYLADRFVREGWSLKKLLRELVLTNAFAMSSRASESADATDPDNRLLHRANVRRLDAEAVRDSILAVSGRLDRTMYGPGVEVHMTPFMDNNYGDDYGRPKSSGPLDGAGRRSVYQIVRRNFMNPMLVAFDFPQPLNTIGRRSVSNVPAQALILMNDPFVAEQAKVWARRVIAAKDADAPARVRRMYLEAFARPPTEAELQTATRFLDHHAEVLSISPERRATDEQLWADLAQVLINVKEFTYLN
jgi:cytochrome c553